MVDKIKSTSGVSQQRLNDEQAAALKKTEEEFNSAFDDNNETEIELTYRGENKRSGVSYDFYYGNEFSKGLEAYYNEGLFEDFTKDESGNDKFTRQDKLNLEAKFKEIHQNNGYDADFEHMQAGVEFKYTKEEYLALAEAAGYRLKKQSNEENKQLNENVELSFTEINGIKQPEILQDEIEGVEIPKDETVTVTFNEEVHTYPDGTSVVKKSESSVTYHNASVSLESDLVGAGTSDVTIDTPQLTLANSRSDASQASSFHDVVKEDSGLKGKDYTAALEIVNNRVSSARDELATLQDEAGNVLTTKEVDRKGIGRIFDSKRTVELTQDELAARQARIEELQAQIESEQLKADYLKKVDKLHVGTVQNPDARFYSDTGEMTSTDLGRYNVVLVQDSDGNQFKAGQLVDALNQPINSEEYLELNFAESYNYDYATGSSLNSVVFADKNHPLQGVTPVEPEEK